MEEKNSEEINSKETVEEDIIVIDDDTPETASEKNTAHKDGKISLESKELKDSEKLAPVRLGVMKPVVRKRKFRTDYQFGLPNDYSPAKKVVTPVTKKKIKDYGDEIVMLTHMKNGQLTSETAAQATSQTAAQSTSQTAAQGTSETNTENDASETTTLGTSKVQAENDYNVPDTSLAKSFICSICHIHVPTAKLWDTHINGKKHKRRLATVRPNDEASTSVSEPICIDMESESSQSGDNELFQVSNEAVASVSNPICIDIETEPSHVSDNEMRQVSKKAMVSVSKPICIDIGAKPSQVSDNKKRQVSKKAMVSVSKPICINIGAKPSQVSDNEKRQVSNEAATSASEPICIDIETEPSQVSDNEILQVSSGLSKRKRRRIRNVKNHTINKRSSDCTENSIPSSQNVEINIASGSSDASSVKHSDSEQACTKKHSRHNTISPQSKIARWSKIESKIHIPDRPPESSTPPDQSIEVYHESGEQEMNMNLSLVSQGANIPGSDTTFAKPTFASSSHCVPSIPPQLPSVLPLSLYGSPAPPLSLYGSPAPPLSLYGSPAPPLSPYGSPTPPTVPMHLSPPVPPQVQSYQHVQMQVSSNQPVRVQVSSNQPIQMQVSSNQPVRMQISSDQLVRMPMSYSQPVPMPHAGLSSFQFRNPPPPSILFHSPVSNPSLHSHSFLNRLLHRTPSRSPFHTPYCLDCPVVPPFTLDPLIPPSSISPLLPPPFLNHPFTPPPFLNRPLLSHDTQEDITITPIFEDIDERLNNERF